MGFLNADGKSLIDSDKIDIIPEKTCCFTGHRPKDLPNGASYLLLRTRVLEHVTSLIAEGIDTFITGMAPGFDLMAADILINEPCVKGRCRTICAIPYLGQLEQMHSPRDRALYQATIASSDCVVCFFNTQTKGCYKVRNQFMVNYSGTVIAYLRTDKQHSGTMQTVNMAKRANRRVIILDETIFG
ncbi:MAG: DUF1273 domain-containing protein [Ruminococcus sp.]|nr:DUF1273 domain-containing protein [Ruminococcus sp.]